MPGTLGLSVDWKFSPGPGLGSSPHEALGGLLGLPRGMLAEFKSERPQGSVWCLYDAPLEVRVSLLPCSVAQGSHQGPLTFGGGGVDTPFGGGGGTVLGGHVQQQSAAAVFGNERLP